MKGFYYQFLVKLTFNISGRISRRMGSLSSTTTDRRPPSNVPSTTTFFRSEFSDKILEILNPPKFFSSSCLSSAQLAAPIKKNFFFLCH
jgi:hypothetical protein